MEHPAASIRIPGITRLGADTTLADDDVAVEEPLEIRVNGRPVAVTMRTPGDDPELAAGFLLSEGVLRSRDDLVAIRPCDDAANIVNVTLTGASAADLSRLTRHVFTSSSCGICGRATIDAVHLRFPPVSDTPTLFARAVLENLPTRLRAGQAAFSRTGGLHAAAVFDAAGTLLCLREDVGRHNAVDKVLGRALLDNTLPLANHILLVSGRASFEILQKALAASIPLVAAISAPSSLAVDFARSNNQTLVGFLRKNAMNIYTHPHRIPESS